MPYREVVGIILLEHIFIILYGDIWIIVIVGIKRGATGAKKSRCTDARIILFIVFFHV